MNKRQSSVFRRPTKPSILKNATAKPVAGKSAPRSPSISRAKKSSKRRDFFGNIIGSSKRHSIFFNFSANKVYIVESYKQFNALEDS